MKIEVRFFTWKKILGNEEKKSHSEQYILEQICLHH